MLDLMDAQQLVEMECYARVANQPDKKKKMTSDEIKNTLMGIRK